MSILGKKWHIAQQKSNDLIQHLLLARGISHDAHEQFLNPDYNKDLHSSFLLSGMDKAVVRIQRALDNGEKIVLYGDYDVDGVCGAALLKQVFCELGARNLSVYIPHRSEEGYGLNIKALDKIISDGTKLVITVDCGSTNTQEIKHAQKNGVDVIVTDHHHVSDEKSSAYAFINPHQKGDIYPFKGLCGTGVAFKLACALLEIKRQKAGFGPAFCRGYEKWMLDLVALATVADIMPLVGENRIFVKYGLLVMAQTKRLGLRALMDVAQVAPTFNHKDKKTNLNTFTLGFILGPRLNAAGRMEHAELAFQLLDAQDEKIARELAEHLDAVNYERRDLVRKIMDEAEQNNMQDAPLIFAGAEHWPIGIAGIVAGRLAEKYYKPAFIYQKMQDKIVGSVRTPNNFHTVEMLQDAANLLEKFGGHKAAGGFTALSENEEKLYDVLCNYAALRLENLDKEDITPKIDIDAELASEKLTLKSHADIEGLQPYGEGNPRPIFMLRDAGLLNLQHVGAEENHLKCVILKDNKRFKAIGFRLAPYAKNLQEGDKADIVFHLGRDDFNGNSQISLELIDLKLKN